MWSKVNLKKTPNTKPPSKSIMNEWFDLNSEFFEFPTTPTDNTSFFRTFSLPRKMLNCLSGSSCFKLWCGFCSAAIHSFIVIVGGDHRNARIIQLFRTSVEHRRNWGFMNFLLFHNPASQATASHSIKPNRPLCVRLFRQQVGVCKLSLANCWISFLASKKSRISAPRRTANREFCKENVG